METCCEKIAKLFYLYMDQELSEQRSEHLKMHLEACGGCKGHLEFEKAARLFLKKKFEHFKASNRLKFLIQKQLNYSYEICSPPLD